jgi:signal transduction histidine kinase
MTTKTRPHSSSKPPAVTAPPAQAALDVRARLDVAHAEIEALYGQLERLNRLASIGTIAGMIAHEFNNILTPMVSYSQMAAASPEDGELVQKALQRTLAGSERAAKIADAILSFVRDDAAAGSVDATGDLFHVEQQAPAVAPVATVVRDALACLGRDVSRHELEAAVHVSENLVAAIHPIALQQVLVNLMLNARNAMRGGGGALEISAARWIEQPPTPKGGVDSRRSQDGNAVRSTRNTSRSGGSRGGPWVCIVIRDSGRGMAADRLARMFRPFDTQSGGEHRGTGLGMVITKRLVERAGGWLIVESALGRGTSVSIVLPAA